MKTQSKPTQSKPKVQAATQSVKHPVKNVMQPPVTNHRDKILQHLEDLKLKMPQEAIDQIVRESTENGYNVWEILERFLAIPSGLKQEQSIASRIRRASFPTEATLESYDWSTAVITNVDFKDWTDYLGDPQIVMAMLDRLVYRSQIIKFDGKSFRAASRPQGAK